MQRPAHWPGCFIGFDDQRTSPRAVVRYGRDRRTLDHGNTVAVQLETPEGNKVAFVMPKAVASTLADEIRIALGAEASATLVQS